MKVMLFIGGIYHAAFAIFHVLFWKLFGWKDDLSSLSVTNRAVMQILNLRLIFVALVSAFVSIFYADELLTTNLGTVLLAAISLFWFGRAIEQVIFFGLKKTVSLIMFGIFLIGTAIYFVALI